MKNIVMQLLISFIISIASLLITFTVASYIPQEYEEVNNLELEEERGRIYTREEFDEISEKARKNMEQKIRLRKEEDRNRSNKEFIKDVKYRTIFFSWVPWLILPFIFVVNSWATGLLLLIIPTILVPTGIFLIIEVIVFGFFLFPGSQLKNVVWKAEEKGNEG